MLMDKLLQVCSAQVVPAATATLSEDVIDLVSMRDIGEGTIWYFLVRGFPADAEITVEVVAGLLADLSDAVPQIRVDVATLIWTTDDHLLIPVVFPHRQAITGSAVPTLAVSAYRYVGLRITSDLEATVDAYGLEAGHAFSPLAYPASTSS